MLIGGLRKLEEICWRNPKQITFEEGIKNCVLSMADEFADFKLNDDATHLVYETGRSMVSKK